MRYLLKTNCDIILWASDIKLNAPKLTLFLSLSVSPNQATVVCLCSTVFPMYDRGLLWTDYLLLLYHDKLLAMIH